MLPVVLSLTPVRHSCVCRHHLILSNHLKMVRSQAGAHDLSNPLTGQRIAVPVHRYQASTLTRVGLTRYPSNGSGMAMSRACSCSKTSATENLLYSACRTSDHKALQRAPNQALSSMKLPNLMLAASCQMRRRLSCTFFSTTPFSHPEATLQKSGSNK